MKLSFNRITTTGSFIPEIDGLRFIAIASVVLYHINGFLLEKDSRIYAINFDFSFLNKFLSYGHLGVPLFFAISGFILGLPFAKFYLLNSQKPSLKNYFIRRLTRLEPPYIIVMTGLLFGSVFIAKKISLNDGLLSYVASLFYSHNLFYPGKLPFLNVVVWSLEIEVQFYILAPFIAKLYSIKKSSIRIISFCSIIFFFIFLDKYQLINLPFKSIVNYLHFFLVGLLLADFYVTKTAMRITKNIDKFVCVFLFALVWLFEIPSNNTPFVRVIFGAIQIAGIFGAYYYILFFKPFTFLSNKVITNIGGMCYSIYMLHYPIISLFGNPMMAIKFSAISVLNSLIYSLLLLILVLGISSLFFLMIERPCMDKFWYKKFFYKKTQVE